MQKVALYRKYRPENFKETIGQEHIKRVLENAIISGNVSHAYLFSGPRGTGKTSLARIIAKALNCKKRKDANPCNRCSICIGINEGKIMDLIEIDAASNRGIDEIRDLREKVKFSPTEGDYKVFIIDEVHMLTKEAFNALLKTLEEPPEHAIFILATTEVHKVPLTIISRCQRHDFRRIKLNDIVSKLSEIAKKEKIKITDEALETIAETAEGGLRDAISLLDQIYSSGLNDIMEEDVENILGLAPYQSVLKFTSGLLKGNINLAVETLNKSLNNGIDIVNFTKSSIELTRKVMFAKLSSTKNLEGTNEQIETINKLAEETEMSNLTRLSEELLWAQENFRTGVDPKAVLIIVCSKLQEEFFSSKEALKKEKANENAPKKPLTIEQNHIELNGKWKHFMMEIKSKNNTIHAFLRVANPELKNGQLFLTFPYKFHKERLEEPKNKKIVEATLSKIYGKQIEVKCFLETNGSQNKKIDNLEKAASILGGEIVD